MMTTIQESSTTNTTKTLVAQFTKRDLILYALGIGCCSEEDTHEEEIRYVYENHPHFMPFPTFLLALSFVAEQQPSNRIGIRSFPPQCMTYCIEDGSECGILPSHFYKNIESAKEAKDLPVLHISQSLIMHDSTWYAERKKENGTDIDPPTQIELKTMIVSVKPRKIGCFVASETTYHLGGKCIASTNMVALILGLDPDKVVSWSAAHQQLGSEKVNAKPSSADNKMGIPKGTITEVQYHMPPNAALLYRLSGDYNSIHVEGNSKRGPVLHGLCTLGYAIRAVLQHVRHHHEGDDSEAILTSCVCNFTNPVYKSTTLRVEVWDDIDGDHTSQIIVCICFRVYRERGVAENKERKDIVVLDKGKAQFCIVTGKEAAKSRL